MKPEFISLNPEIKTRYSNTHVSLTSHPQRENALITRHHITVPAFRELRWLGPLKRWQRVTTLCLVLLMLFGGGPIAFGQLIPDLFSDRVLPSDTAVSDAAALLLEKAALKEEQDPTITRSRHVKVNMEVFQKEGPIGLNLFQDVYVILIRSGAKALTATANTIVGHIEGEEGLSQVLLSKLEGNLEGEILVHGRAYEIRHLGQGYHAIREIDRSTFSHRGDSVENSPASRAALTFQNAVIPSTFRKTFDPFGRLDTGEIIEILIVYTRNARIGAGGTAEMKAHIHRTIAQTNDIFSKSGVNPRLRLVHTAEVNYTESTNSSTDFERLRGKTDSFLSEVHQLRNAWGADLLSLWVETLVGSSNCGWGGWGANNGTLNSERSGFSVVARNCATSNLSFAHEIGHSVGLDHEEKNGFKPYGRGFKNLEVGVCTLMATVSGCPNGERVTFYSTPNRTVNGVDLGEGEKVHSVRSLNETAHDIANFRPSKKFIIDLITAPLSPDAGLNPDTFTGTGTGNLPVLNPTLPVCAECVDWNTMTTTSFSNQDRSANVTVQEGGAAILLRDNTWRRTTQTFTITPKTVLKFEFRSTSQGEIHAIGFDENTILNDSPRFFHFWGTQTWTGGGKIHFTPQYSGNGGTQTVTIPVGQFYTGTGMALVLANDEDTTSGSQGVFRNVRVFEASGNTPLFPQVGTTQILSRVTTAENRRAMPYTMPEDGWLRSVSMYHKGGTGKMRLAVYTDANGSPGLRIATTAPTAVSGTTGWQPIYLANPVFVPGGTTIWLAWVYETNPGIYYASGTPGRVSAGPGGAGGMPDAFGGATQANWMYSIYATYVPAGEETPVGTTQVLSRVTTAENRRAMPYTMPEDGSLHSVSMYHKGGTGDMMLAVYADANGRPGPRLATTASAAVSGMTGWQSIYLTNPVVVSGGTTIWLAWVYETNPGIYYASGTPGRMSAGPGWAGGMPDAFGGATQAKWVYSIYATYVPPLLSPTARGLPNATAPSTAGVFTAGTLNTTTSAGFPLRTGADPIGVGNKMKKPLEYCSDLDAVKSRPSAPPVAVGYVEYIEEGNPPKLVPVNGYPENGKEIRITKDYTLPQNCDDCKNVQFNITNSNIVFDGNGNTLHVDNYNNKFTGVRVTPRSALHEIVIRNLNIEGYSHGIMIAWIIARDSHVQMNEERKKTFTKYANNIEQQYRLMTEFDDKFRTLAPHCIHVEKVHIKDTINTGFHLHSWVHNVTFDQGSVTHARDVGIYLGAGTRYNTISRSTITDSHREGIAIDASAYNLIHDSTFKNNERGFWERTFGGEHARKGGGILLYKNCGEQSDPRTQHSEGNRIQNNRFVSERVGVWIGSRQSAIRTAGDRTCEDPIMVKLPGQLGKLADQLELARYYRDYAENTVVEGNTFVGPHEWDIDEIRGIVVEDDGTRIVGNTFKGLRKLDIEIGSPTRNLASDPVYDTLVRDNTFEYDRELLERCDVSMENCTYTRILEEPIWHGHCSIGTQFLNNRIISSSGISKPFPGPSSSCDKPLAPNLLTPLPGTTITAGSVTFTGEHKGATHHWLWVGTGRGKFNIENAYLGLGTSRTVTIPTTLKGKDIYLRYWSRINDTFVFADYTYSVKLDFLYPPVRNPSRPSPSRFPGSSVLQPMSGFQVR